MKNFVPLLLCAIAPPSFSQTTPNYVQTEIMFSADSTDSVQKSTIYSDGLGRTLQSRLELGGGRGLYSIAIYNSVGRPCTTSVPFVRNDTGYFSSYYRIDSIRDKRGNRCPFNTIKYKPDPLNRYDSIGSPDTVFSLDGTHFSRYWYLGTKYPFTDTSSNIDSNGFIRGTLLRNGKMDTLESQGMFIDTPTHYLTVSKSPNDSSYTQEIKDVFGRTLSTCSMQGIRAEYLYDKMGNLLRENPPHASNNRQLDTSMATIYRYNTRGLLIYKKTPDAGEVYYKYDNAGRLRFVQNQRQRDTTPANQIKYAVYLYDALGRNIAIGINKTQPAFPLADPNALLSIADIYPRIQRVYDDTSLLANVLGVSATALYSVSSQPIINTKGRLIAEIAYQADNLVPGMPGFFDNITVEVYSYNQEGNVFLKLNRKPRMSDFSVTTRSYDYQGNLTAKGRFANERMLIMHNYYNKQGQINSVSASFFSQILSYGYDDYGRLSTKKFIADSLPIDIVSYNYNIRNWPTSIQSANNFFNETNIYYYEAGTPQYNGNISAVNFCYNGIIHSLQTYNYDNVNRLTQVNAQDTAHFMSEQFSYQGNGRMATKQKGADSMGVYNYYPGTNRLSEIAHHRTKNHSNNYVYDPNGNMVVDYSKKMAVMYDWRDMPVSFKFFDAIPTSVLTNADLWKDPQGIITAAGGKLVSEVKMVYDAGGNRAVKQEYKY